MKFPSRFALPVLALAGCFTVSAAFAQAPAAPAKEKLVEFKDIKISVQKTPDFALKGGTTDKRVRPKEWIEIEPEFKTGRPAGAKKAEVIPELTFKYYVYLNSTVKENARILTGEVIHVNVPIDELNHSVMYISPSTVLRVTGKPEGNPQLVSAYAVEVTSAGNVVGFFSKAGGATSTNPADKKWWDLPSAPTKDEGGLLNKVQSPFAPLWADYYADVKGVK
ncbi:MAG: Amuc_1102 family pilus-like protein [Verrucomicrobiota bacterium]